MGKTLLFGALALMVLVQSPFIFALETIDCGDVDPVNRDVCIEIKNSDLSDEEKNLLISNLDYSNELFPDHDYILQRNTNIGIAEAPEGVQIQDSGYIRNAWVDVFGAMPSVLYNNDLYVPSETKILTGFNHEVVIPSNYISPRYPRASQGDCKRIYSLVQNRGRNKVYVNGNYQGGGKLVDTDIDSDSEISAIYSVDITIRVDHYEWEPHNDHYHCEYDYRSQIRDHLDIVDAVYVKHYDNNLFVDVQSIGSHSSTAKLRTNFSNSVVVDFEDSQYSFNEFIYDVAYSKSQYYVYTLEAKDYNREKLQNILKDGNDLLIRNTNNCYIRAFDFFQTLEKLCNLNGEDISFQIKTNKLKYKLDETIVVEIIPEDLPVTITYGGESVEAIGIVNFVAKPLHNKIIARNGDRTAEKVIFLVDGDKLKVYWNLSIFVLLNYCIYVTLRRGIGRYI